MSSANDFHFEFRWRDTDDYSYDVTVFCGAIIRYISTLDIRREPVSLAITMQLLLIGGQLLDESILECGCWKVVLDADEVGSWELRGMLILEEGSREESVW